MRTLDKTLFILLHIFFLIFIPPAATKFALQFEELNNGRVCAKMQCTFTDGDESVNIRDLVAIELSKENSRGGFDTFLVAEQDDNGQWSRDTSIQDRVVERTQTTDLSVKSDATSIVLEAFIERRTGIADDVNVCDESQLSTFECYIVLTDGTDKLAEFEKKTTTTVIDQGGPTEEQTITFSVLEVMTTLADAVDKFNLLMDTRSDMVVDKSEKVKRDMLDNTKNFLIDFDVFKTTILRTTETLATENQQLIVKTNDDTNNKLNSVTEDLEKQIDNLLADIDKTLENTNTNLTTSLDNLSSSVNNKIDQLNTTSEKSIEDLDSFLHEIFGTLNTSISSLEKSTQHQVIKTNKKIQQEISDTANTTENNFNTIRQNSKDDFNMLENNFEKKVQDLQTNLEESITVATDKIIADGNSVEESFDEQINLVMTSIMEISQDLNESVKKTSEDLITYLRDVESNLANGIESVEKDLEQQTTSLQNQISQQKNSTQKKIESTSSSVVDIIKESTQNLINESKDSTETLKKSIADVDGNLKKNDEELQITLETLNANLTANILSANQNIAKRIRKADENILTQIETVSTGITQDISKVENEQGSASSLNLDKTTEQIIQVESNIANRINELNVTIRENINQLEGSTKKELNGINTQVTQDLKAIADYVDEMSSETQGLIKNFADDTTDNLGSVKRDVIDDIEQLQSLTQDVVNNVNTKTKKELNKMDTDLDTSLRELETGTMENVAKIQTQTQKSLDDLQGQADGINNQVNSLTNEIKDEQNMITTLQNKYGNLTTQLEGITNQIDQYQSTLTAYQNTSKTMFNEARADINARGEKTLDQLSGLVTKIKGMNRNMTTALESFHKKVDELSENIVDIGTRVTGFTQTNIGEIIEHMDENTDIITGYLQPKKCTRNMNYVSISNSQNVVIVPNEESDIDFEILCDTATDGGGWIIIQRRTSNDVSFYKDWSEYKDGFGSLQTDFYMGNELIHILTSKNNYELRVTAESSEQEFIANYGTFQIGSEKSSYMLKVGNYSGTAGDALSYHNEMPFSTRDNDNDNSRRRSCATTYKSGWWYDNCRTADLNGEWQRHVHWLDGPLESEIIYSTEMKIRLK